MRRRPSLRVSDRRQLELFDVAGMRRPAAPPQTATAAEPADVIRLGTSATLPTIRAGDLAGVQDSEPEWMIEGLWGAEAVGIIGGEPKQGKTFLALDMAVAVATGAPCLRHFQTHSTGPVLLYAAEDSHRVLCQRLQGIAAAAGVSFETLDIHVIATPALRIDRADQQRALRATVARLRPALLILDPLVRLHAGDENASREMAALLGYLRSLQREFHAAVVLVHHARKNAARERGGQALRGSSDLHAWGDSNLYLRRNGKGSYLDIEHRAAPGIDKLPLELVAEPPVLGFRVIEQPQAPPNDSRSPLERVVDALAAAAQPVSQRQLRRAVHLRASLVTDLLEQLIAAGRVARCPDGYCLTS